MFDLLVKNGTVIDGSGSPMFRADVGVKEGMIVEIGDLRDEVALRTVDASGRYVVPGFIDVNNHSDAYWEMFRNPAMHGMLLQGVTTVIGGSSGSSLAPIVGLGSIRSIRKWTDTDSLSLNWRSMKDFLGEMDRHPLSVNFATLVGHGTVRRGVLGAPTEEVSEMRLFAMESLLRRSLSEGALGFSTALGYTHARLAGKREIEELLRSVSRHGGIYAAHLRDEGSGLLHSVDEAVSSAKVSGVPLHISHFKASGRPNWPLFADALDRIRVAVENGSDITFDAYPYTSSASVLYALLPEWVTESGREVMLYRLRDSETRKAVVRDMKAGGADYGSMRIFVSNLNRMTGSKTVGEISRVRRQSPEEVVIDVLLGSGGYAIVSLEVASPENVERAIRHPLSVVSSNGVGYSVGYASTGNKVHPRNFGTFPKVFETYVKGRGVLSWEEAVYKMTGKPAVRFGISDRGFLRERHKADIVVFDPEGIADRSTMDDPFRYPDGITTVIVNGTVTAEDGKWNGELPGETIRSARKRLFR
jgi:N-acyl-D-amino-acid deacylase